MGEIKTVKEIKVSTSAAGLVQPDPLKQFNLTVETPSVAAKYPMFSTPAQEDLVYRQVLNDRLNNMKIFSGNSGVETFLNTYAVQGLSSITQQANQVVTFQTDRLPPVLNLPTIASKPDISEEKLKVAVFPSVGGIFQRATFVGVGSLVKKIDKDISLSVEMRMYGSTEPSYEPIEGKVTALINVGKDQYDPTRADISFGVMGEQSSQTGSTVMLVIRK